MRDPHGPPVLDSPPLEASFQHLEASALLRVKSFERLDQLLDSAQVVGFHFDTPAVELEQSHRSLRISGWVLGLRSPIQFMTVYDPQGIELRRCRATGLRPDVFEAYPGHVPHVCGFDFDFGVLVHEQSIRYTLRAFFADGTHAKLAYLMVQAGHLVDYVPQINPLLVTSIGRTGSTLLINALAGHPQIVGYDPHLYDARTISYWCELFASLAQPYSYLQSVAPGLPGEPQWWLGGEMPLGTHLPLPATQAHLARQPLGDFANFVLRQIDGFYSHVADVQNQFAPVFFVEKMLPRLGRVTLRNLLPQAQEILLVRDPRDTLTSILAFNKQRGFHEFGRQAVQTDLEYVKMYRGSIDAVVRLLDSEQRPVQLVKYEDLALKPHQSFAAILTSLGLEQSNHILDQMLTAANANIPTHHRTTSTVHESIGRWRNDLPTELRDACNEHLSEFCVRLGYPAE